jgi:hypothetical protein
MFVCCVLSGRGLCDELITRPEESCRLWRVVVCDHENLVGEEAIARAELQSQRKKTLRWYPLHRRMCRCHSCCIRVGEHTDLYVFDE